MAARTTARTLLACAVALLLLCGCVSPAGDAEPEERTFAPGSDQLTIVVDHGDLEVSPTQTNEIQVKRWVSGRSVIGEPGVTWGLDGETLVLRSRCNQGDPCQVRYEVHVPEGTSLTVEGGSGRVEATAFGKPLTISTVEGSVEVQRVSGPLSLRSTEGDLRAGGVRSRTLRASTGSGRIDVSFIGVPDDVRVVTEEGSATLELLEAVYDVDASGGGDVVIEVDTDEDSPHKIAAETDSGRIRLVPAD
ncbi:MULTISPECIES: DUF4097 family beta strand repeat-containing protein [Nocardiopsis]|uniref:DUF4097 domain-containing protein n=1 Tax=Nocardiopsis sinuspersici TaxID=501010 RepID=A0A1V3C944_9ACTN|nr:MULTISPECIES: DUF4097 family beta strand repeat-containing protein [Nocardiopsis]OOC57046.1 hypothetical protein NOSIN_06755 [Nocardiopsis sinuspersici]